MRLWHKSLIPYLPKQQLLGQWRELNSIYKRQNRHILINFIYDYDPVMLYYYSKLVINEMNKRNYKINLDNFIEYFRSEDINNSLFGLKDVEIDIDEIYKDKMDDRYLKQNLYNLQEKYDCGGISEDDWDRILYYFGEFFNDEVILYENNAYDGVDLWNMLFNRL